MTSDQFGDLVTLIIVVSCCVMFALGWQCNEQGGK